MIGLVDGIPVHLQAVEWRTWDADVAGTTSTGGSVRHTVARP
jgi:hypothetical protein